MQQNDFIMRLAVTVCLLPTALAGQAYASQPAAHPGADLTLGHHTAPIIAGQRAIFSVPNNSSGSPADYGARSNVLLADFPQDADQDSSSDPGSNASTDNVFNWTEVPQGQNVTITRAVFDRNGYQLFDDQGETIVVPFVNNNLYVMKFGRSDDDNTYFINDGSTPTLLLPQGGYVENATVTGARWYPFPQNFDYTQPVYMGPASTWSGFIGMGWYPGMVYYGGYWGSDPWYPGEVFVETPGTVFIIDRQRYYGWGRYHSYMYGHPHYDRMRFYHPERFRSLRDSSRVGGRPFGGGGRSTGRPFGGNSPSRFGKGTGGKHPDTFGGGNKTHTFGGGSTGTTPHHFGGGSTGTTPHHFGGGSTGTTPHHFGGGSTGTTPHHFGGGNGGNTHTFGGGNGGSHTFGGGNGGTHTSGGGSANRTYGGGNGGGHTNNGGGSRHSEGGSHSSGGDKKKKK